MTVTTNSSESITIFAAPIVNFAIFDDETCVDSVPYNLTAFPVGKIVIDIPHLHKQEEIGVEMDS